MQTKTGPSTAAENKKPGKKIMQASEPDLAEFENVF